MLGGPRIQLRQILPRHIHSYSGGSNGPAH
jgi:hypothetical protein